MQAKVTGEKLKGWSRRS